MAACPECGAENPDGAVACASCKHPFGRTLHAELAEEQPKLGRALDLASWIARSIAAMHDAKVVHQNLTPRHIYLVKRKGQDDALKLLNPNKAPAEGTARDYAAPEELDGKASDPLSNIYSYGVIVHEMVVGARPNPGGPSGKIPPEVPGALADLILHCTKKSPSQRPQSMHEVEERVSALNVAHRAGVLVKPPAPPEPGRPMRWVVPLLLLPVLAVGGYFVWIKLIAPPPPPPVVVPPPPPAALPDAAAPPPDLGHPVDASQPPDLAVAAKPAAAKPKHPKPGAKPPAPTQPAPAKPEPGKPAPFDPFAPQVK